MIPSVVDKMRHLVPDQFHCLVKMHLSFLLDLNTDECNCSFLYENDVAAATPSKKKSFTLATPKRKGSNHDSKASSKGVMEGAPLTMEGVCQVFQIIEYLKRPSNLTAEGLFRKHGNLKKQQILKERLNKGIPVDLDSGDFTVHECASTLKTFLSDLTEPLLTDAYYRAHCQVASLPGPEIDAFAKKMQCLQLLFLLIPEANYALLKDLLCLLKKVIDNVEHNKMNSSNLATVFATHIMCPRKLAPDCLQSNHQLFIKAVSFMIENTEDLFSVPSQLVKDVDMFWKSNPEKDVCVNRQLIGPSNSPVVNTVFSFVDRERTKEAAAKSTTETALAELYAQVQSMPESAQKKRLISKLNEANGYGTPSLTSKRASSRIKSLLTPKSAKGSAMSKKSKNHASYSLRNPPPFDSSLATPSFKRSDSRETTTPMVTFSDASPALKKPEKPKPPPRVSSLKNQPDDKEVLLTPRCRKPLLSSPSLDSPMMPPPPDIMSSPDDNASVSSSFISDEVNQLVNGELDPSTSMTYFLEGGKKSPSCSDEENSSPNVPSPGDGLRKARKRSITELGGPNPLAKMNTPTRNCDNVYFETDL